MNNFKYFFAQIRLASSRKNFASVIILFFFFSENTYAQGRSIIIYDLENSSIDSIHYDAFDTIAQNDYTPYYIGDFDSNIEILEQETPEQNVFPDSEFTLKKKAGLDYDINNFPLRTSTKLTFMYNDTIRDLCSGNMISQKHVLTAAHCISGFNFQELYFDTIMVCPAYDNGAQHPVFGCSGLSKVFLLKDWQLQGEDFAILELQESIGQNTGWISLGFEEIDSEFEDDIFYKFTYPIEYLSWLDPNPYNGDTLYYNYGRMNFVDEMFIGSLNAYGIPGESGSSVIKIINNQVYTTYGVLTFIENISHSRITKQMFYMFKDIIQDDLLSNNEQFTSDLNLKLFPNPMNDYFQIENFDRNKVVTIVVSDLLGRMVLQESNYKSGDQVDISHLPSGQYYLMVKTDTQMAVEKMIVVGS